MKRVPARKIGKGKAVPSSAVIGTGQGKAIDASSDKLQQQMSTTGVKARLGFTSMSKRFGDEEEMPKIQDAVHERYPQPFPVLTILWISRSDPANLGRKMTKLRRWLLCSKRRLMYGRKRKRKCHSQCRLENFHPNTLISASSLIAQFLSIIAT